MIPIAPRFVSTIVLAVLAAVVVPGTHAQVGGEDNSDSPTRPEPIFGAFNQSCGFRNLTLPSGDCIPDTCALWGEWGNCWNTNDEFRNPELDMLHARQLAADEYIIVDGVLDDSGWAKHPEDPTWILRNPAFAMQNQSIVQFESYLPRKPYEVRLLLGVHGWWS